MRDNAHFFWPSAKSYLPAHRPLASLRLVFGEPTQAGKAHRPMDGLEVVPMIFKYLMYKAPMTYDLKACFMSFYGYE